MNIPTTRRRSIGLAAGALWCIAISAVFAAWSLLAIATPVATFALVGVLLGVAVLLAIGVSRVRQAWRLPGRSTPRTAEERALGRRFAFIVGLEVLGFAVVNPVVAVMGDVRLLPALNLIIVGLHFLPLARLFRVPRYYLMGALFCVIPIATLLGMSANAVVGHALGWFVVPSLGCAMVATLTGAVGLREARHSMAAIRMSPLAGAV